MNCSQLLSQEDSRANPTAVRNKGALAIQSPCFVSDSECVLYPTYARTGAQPWDCTKSVIPSKTEKHW
jgi:hypothetical protein